MMFNHRDLTAALNEARAAEEASRTSAATLRRSAVAMHEDAHAAAVANVRRDLSGALVRYPAWLPETRDPAKITEAEAALIWARGHDLRDGATALRHEPKPSPEVRK